MAKKFNVREVLQAHTEQKSALLDIYKQCKIIIRKIKPLLERTDVEDL
tara:strand:- start:987 stop:1130 length:144 start_codon:yes stop_codon:yes gene_type:complete